MINNLVAIDLYGCNLCQYSSYFLIYWTKKETSFFFQFAKNHSKYKIDDFFVEQVNHL